MTTTSTRPGSMLLGAGRYWDQRASSCVQDVWQPAHPLVSCPFVSKDLFVAFRVFDSFSGVDRGSQIRRCGRLGNGTNPGVARVRRVVGSEGNQAGTIYSKLASVSHFHRVDAQMELATSSPLVKRALKAVERLHVAAGARTKSAARCCETLCRKDSPWARCEVRAAVCCGCVSRWVIFSWHGRTKFSHRRPVWCTPYIAKRGEKNHCIRGCDKWEGCSGTRSPALSFSFAVKRVTEPNIDRSSYARARSRRGHVPR